MKLRRTYHQQVAIKKLNEIITKINFSLSQQHHPTGAVVTSYVNQCLSTITSIEQIAQKVEDNSDIISINLDLIKNTEDSQEFNPKDYKEDIPYIRKNTEFKMESLQSEFSAHKSP